MVPAFPLPAVSPPASTAHEWPSFQWPGKMAYPWRLGPGTRACHGVGVAFVIHRLMLSNQLWPGAEEQLCEESRGGQLSFLLWGHGKCSARYYRAFPSPFLPRPPVFLLLKTGATSPVPCSLRQVLTESTKAEARTSTLGHFPPTMPHKQTTLMTFELFPLGIFCDGKYQKAAAAAASPKDEESLRDSQSPTSMEKRTDYFWTAMQMSWFWPTVRS